jgi:hypothetical protein
MVGSDSTPLLAVAVYAKALFDLLPVLDPARPPPHDVPANGSRVVNRPAAVESHALPQDRHGGPTTASAEPVDPAGHLPRVAAAAAAGPARDRLSSDKALATCMKIHVTRLQSWSSRGSASQLPNLPDARLRVLDQADLRRIHAAVFVAVNVEQLG